jgi:hypothetical protein
VHCSAQENYAVTDSERLTHAIHAIAEGSEATAGGGLIGFIVPRYFNSRNERKNIVDMRILALVMTMVSVIATSRRLMLRTTLGSICCYPT